MFLLVCEEFDTISTLFLQNYNFACVTPIYSLLWLSYENIMDCENGLERWLNIFLELNILNGFKNYRSTEINSSS